VLSLSVYAHADVAVPVGSLAVNDDTDGFPLALLDAAVDQSVLYFVQSIAAGEAGDILPTGVLLVENVQVADQLTLYSATYAVLATISAPQTTCVTTNRVDAFYILKGGLGLTHATVRHVSNTGVLGAAWTLTGNVGVLGIAVDPTETVLYFIKSGAGPAIKRWDLVNDIALPDLVALGTVALAKDLLCLTDGSVLVLSRNASVQNVRRYDDTGALLTTYPLTFALSSSGGDRLAHDVTDANFWVQQKDANVVGTFTRFRVSDAAVLATRTFNFYEGGAYQGAQTATPAANFGPSFSCPFWVTRVAFPAAGTGTITVIKATVPPADPTVFAFTAGGGLTPITFTLTDGGNQAFLSLPPASGYSIAETADPDYSTVIVVSNGNLPSNITVGAGDDILVTVTNTRVTPPAGPPGCPLGSVPAVTGLDGCANANDF
jgi:hypothetical protein